MCLHVGNRLWHSEEIMKNLSVHVSVINNEREMFHCCVLTVCFVLLCQPHVELFISTTNGEFPVFTVDDHEVWDRVGALLLLLL